MIQMIPQADAVPRSDICQLDLDPITYEIIRDAAQAPAEIKAQRRAALDHWRDSAKALAPESLRRIYEHPDPL